MTKLFFTLFFGTLLLSCGNNNNNNNLNNNPYLTPPIVSLNLNLNLPGIQPFKVSRKFSHTKPTGNKGIVIYNVNNDLYTAFDLGDPNHIPNSCSKMTLEGIIATCTCNDGGPMISSLVKRREQGNQEVYPMLQYRIQRNGNSLTLTN
ncbi:MAG: hypothetical protein R2793_02580 [Flavobacteriaceae bacterium]